MYKPNACEDLKKNEKYKGKGTKSAAPRAYMIPAFWRTWHAVRIEKQLTEFPDCHEGEEPSARTAVDREENSTK